MADIDERLNRIRNRGVAKGGGPNITRTAVLRLRTLPEQAVPLVEEFTREFFESIEKPMTTVVRNRMRRGVSPYEHSERASLRSEVVTTKNRVRLRVWSNQVTAAVDEGGAHFSGKRPPSGPDTTLYLWVKRTLDSHNTWFTAKRVAMAIQRRGLPRPGDPLRRPFESTREEFEPQIKQGLREARDKAAYWYNLMHKLGRI